MRLLWEEVWGVLSDLSFKDASPAYSRCKRVPLSGSVLLAGSAGLRGSGERLSGCDSGM